MTERINENKHGDAGRIYLRQSDRPVGDVLKEMRKNVWTPPPGAKSSLELLREARDR
jgi:hypothetical protein